MDKIDLILDTCKKCGNCCRDTIPLISDSEIEVWTKNNDVEILNNIEPYMRWHTFKKKNNACTFFDGEKCLIHDKKPESCRLFPHSKDSAIELDCDLFDLLNK